MMFRAFLFHTDAGAYWSVVDGDTYKTGRSPTRSCSTFLKSTSRKYAEGVALYFSYCGMRGKRWTDPNMTAFQMWLQVAPSPRRSAPVRQHLFDTARPARSDNHINLISYVGCSILSGQL